MAKKKINKNENYRDRKHNLILYPDDATHCAAMDIIHKSYDYANCLHDKDIDENGELKKAHYHYVVRFQQAKWRSAIAKELGITDNYIEQCANLNNSLLYLIHYNDAEKHQYSIDDVKGPLKIKLQDVINSTGVTEVELATKIMDYIESCDSRININEFVRFCIANGCWLTYRRCPSVWHKVIEEHNFYKGRKFDNMDKFM